MNHFVLPVIFLLSMNTALANPGFEKDSKQSQPLDIKQSHHIKRYGHWLFNGSFSQNSFSAINPEYRLVQGDKLSLQVWGAVSHQQEVIVDPQGYIFIPKVGPVKVLGVSNKDLNHVILQRVKRVYKNNVDVYASLLSSQKIKVFLSGMVNKPGMYEGQSADTVLRFIDQAGGIHSELGGYRQVQVKRHGTLIRSIDLYDFLQNGHMPDIQLQDGDVILVKTIANEVTIEGAVGFNGTYEVKPGDRLDLILNKLALKPEATHVTVIQTQKVGSESQIQAKQYSIEEANIIPLKSGALIKVSAQNKIKQISVKLNGEHESAQEMVLPWGASLADLIAKVRYTSLSNKKAVQLYRKSVAKRQYDMLQASLSALEQSILTTRSDSKEAAELRKAEADIILRWIEKARKVQPKGQVVLSQASDFNKIILQQGDEVVIPAQRHLVMVHGDVMFPTAISYQNEMNIQEFIKKAGGSTTGELDDMNVLLMKPNGEFVKADDMLQDQDKVEAGDEIFVLAKPDEKNFQFAKDLSQVLYQVAMSAAVVVAL